MSSSAESSAILVPMDGSTPSFQAFFYALDLAKCTNSRLKLLNVIESKHLAPEAETAIKRGEVLCQENDIKFESKILHGDIDKTIVQESADAWLIVMGTHGHKGWKKMMVGGSCTEDVLCHAKVPVLTIRGKAGAEGPREAPLRLRNILVPFVDSREGRAAVDAALCFKKMLRESKGEEIKIQLLSVVLRSTTLGMSMPKDKEEEELRAEAAKSGVQVELARHSDARECFAEPVVLPGKSSSLADNIIAFLGTNPADLVVMGMQHKDGWDLSAIEALVRETVVPVLTVTISPQHDLHPVGVETASSSSSTYYTMTGGLLGTAPVQPHSPPVKREGDRYVGGIGETGLSGDSQWREGKAEEKREEQLFKNIEAQTGVKRQVSSDIAGEKAGQPMTGSYLAETQQQQGGAGGLGLGGQQKIASPKVIGLQGQQQQQQQQGSPKIASPKLTTGRDSPTIYGSPKLHSTQTTTTIGGSGTGQR